MTKGITLKFVKFFLDVGAVNAIPMVPTQNPAYQAVPLPGTNAARGQNAAPEYAEIDETQINAQMHPRIHPRIHPQIHDMYLTVR